MLPESALLNYFEAHFKGFGIKYPLIYVSGRPRGHPEKEVVKILTCSLVTADITIIPIPDWSRLSEHFLI